MGTAPIPITGKRQTEINSHFVDQSGTKLDRTNLFGGREHSPRADHVFADNVDPTINWQSNPRIVVPRYSTIPKRGRKTATLRHTGWHAGPRLGIENGPSVYRAAPVRFAGRNLCHCWADERHLQQKATGKEIAESNGS